MYTIEQGWFGQVNGVPVVKKPVDYSTTTYRAGHPIGILWHFTAGCSDDISGTLASKGFGAAFNVGRNGVVYQYAPVGTATWHAFDASRYYVGIEHTAYPQRCDLTEDQLIASSKLSAAIVEWVESRHGFVIPRTKLSAPISTADFAPGFLDHRDGDRTWNRNVHTDHLYLWSWRRYLEAVEAELTGESQEDSMAFEDFKNGWKAFRAGKAMAEDKPQDWKWGWQQARWASTMPKAEVGVEIPAHEHPHEHSLSGKAV